MERCRRCFPNFGDTRSSWYPFCKRKTLARSKTLVLAISSNTRRLTLPDGTKTLGLVMWRKVNGKWQYRKPTLEEEDDYVSRDAW